jgi:hypothetical protein
MRKSAALMSLLAMAAPGHERDPAPNERWDVLEVGFSMKIDGVLEGCGASSQRSGLNVPASGPQ